MFSPIRDISCCICIVMTLKEAAWGMVDLEATTDLYKRGKVTIHFGELIISSDFDSGTDRLTRGGRVGGGRSAY